MASRHTWSVLAAVLACAFIAQVATAQSISTPLPGPWPGVRANLLRLIPRCNDAARVWVRMWFHDCGTWNATERTGGCDGSLVLELDRPENLGLRDATVGFKSIADAAGVTLADVIILAANLAVERCGGPNMPFVPGRPDATAPNVRGLLPSAFSTSSQTVTTFARMGLDVTDTVALILGGHTIARVHKLSSPDLTNLIGRTDSRPLDATDSTWDNNIAVEMSGRTPRGRFRIPADSAINADPLTRPIIVQFARSPSVFGTSFVNAYNKLSITTLLTPVRSVARTTNPVGPAGPTPSPSPVAAPVAAPAARVAPPAPIAPAPSAPTASPAPTAGSADTPTDTPTPDDSDMTTDTSAADDA